MQREDLTKEFLENQYLTLRKDTTQIGQETGFDKRVIWKLLVKFNIPRRRRGGGAKRRRDLLGETFGKLTVVAKWISPEGLISWECVCDCGNNVEATSKQLFGGKSSCGCGRRLSQSNNRWRGVGEMSRVYWGDICRGAKARSLEVSISPEEAWQLYLLQERKCALTGQHISFSRNRKLNPDEQTASLNRIDSRVGYVPGNVRWIHKDINRVRQDYDDPYFIEMCCLVARHHEEHSKAA